MTRKVREDSHGNYIVINGSIYRPYPTKWIFGKDSTTVTVTSGPILVNDHWTSVNGTTATTAGTTTTVKRVDGTPYCVVNGNELWTTHGDSHWWDYKENKAVAFDTETVWAGDPRRYSERTST